MHPQRHTPQTNLTPPPNLRDEFALVQMKFVTIPSTQWLWRLDPMNPATPNTTMETPRMK